MSSSDEKKENEYVKRFVEVCGTHRPTIIASILNISYQAAKNYLNGRVPDHKSLLKIADKTPYSIHWLLTGKGEKFVVSKSENSLSRFIENLNERDSSDFLSKFGIFLDNYVKIEHTSTNSPKTVILTPDKIRKEKVKEKNPENLQINPS